MNELDQDVVNLSKAIRQVESNKDPNARGASGEFGYYQFMPDTWASTTRKFLGREVPVQQATPELQNEVAYKQIKEWKDAGYNPGQIASMWNAGPGKPNAYIEGNAGTNEYGVNFDTKKYAENVAKTYQEIKSGSSLAPTSHAEENIVMEPQQDKPKKDLLQSATDIVTSIFPGKQVGEAIGTLGGYIATPKEQKKFYDTSAPSPLQVGADIAQGALTVGAGMPGKAVSMFGKTVPIIPTAASALGRIGQSTVLGAGIAGTGTVAKGETDLGEIGKTTAIGGAVGGALGTVGEVVRKAGELLPERFLRSFVPGVNEKTAEYAVNRGLGTPKKMFADSSSSMTKLEAQLEKQLQAKGKEYMQPVGEEIFDSVAREFRDSGLTGKDVAEEIKRLLPLKRSLVDKVLRGEATLKELHSLNSALGRSTFKTVFDDPTVKAGKEIGNAAYHRIRDVLVKAVPEVDGTLKNLSLEYQLNTALEKAIRRGIKAKTFTLKDLVGIMAGLQVAGPMGILGGYAAGRAASSPSVNLGVAGLLQSIGPKEGLKGLAPLILKPTENL